MYLRKKNYNLRVIKVKLGCKMKGFFNDHAVHENIWLVKLEDREYNEYDRDRKFDEYKKLGVCWN